MLEVLVVETEGVTHKPVEALVGVLETSGMSPLKKRPKTALGAITLKPVWGKIMLRHTCSSST
jgi:hypothetical protein